MASLQLDSVRKSYGSVNILHGIDLSIDDGEFIVLVGPSGCGKSTLLRMIAGLETITSGDIVIGERRVNQLQPKERDIAMVFQNYALYPHMTVRDNMSFSMRLKGLQKADIDAAVVNAAAILDLGEYLDRYPKQLSGGQRQRVAMGRAIVRQPSAFLFDEPLSNLDAKLRVQMRTEIKALQQRLKTTSVYVTHDQSEAMTMADRIVVMNRGRIEQIGHPLDVYDHPNSTFVAAFIGSPGINLLEGVVEETGLGKSVSIGAVAMPLPDGAPAQAGEKVVYGIRPEHFALSTDGAGIPATVHLIEPNGPDTLIIAHLGDTEIRILTKERPSLKEGQPIFLRPSIESVHLFDTSSGQRLN
ncbi:sn-glycerol-3-phosphate ABC transporter ATP-binding protein UgpC [Agrobacterium salinitolerans]|uniref:Sn-glycerol-3-phosphate ABC transporter ATP-binding protein UgpC n=1 Tax=Agrobacterium salinitolerans TaxID=1183413 RepID=A0A9X3R0X8_9HYPH|nr:MULTISPECIES: sn-glycerol-3-phosphate ABC transporter ATP-binding protein UgpC [Agrobacterium]MCZ7854629.1 sn-glycerol-3-phosphate ABC transporter ATP-binding protein UgpC [Agrobacterium salinitolerans]MCZ7893970.1 sn-glycerol-3-phosphate ABC transporter ATP-binding protein UgpC [Agrobacterium salinitolerans]MCZ7939921.1 sn-glycerol-3-phosphate ABC transporter ATP-binding protein UgpC [Agrobacterium salinitolerans]TRA84259.1 sn-glycerol-3-phosphate ABC transporter ATP-binding protein UgpC [A